MSAASIKFWELAKHLQKVKGRIVYRGDCAKDEEGAAADEPFSEGGEVEAVRPRGILREKERGPEKSRTQLAK
ncbi:hypothetical protein AK812_SmicGene46014, partial [Symbiodinium microadriaticum]